MMTEKVDFFKFNVVDLLKDIKVLLQKIYLKLEEKNDQTKTPKN